MGSNTVTLLYQRDHHNHEWLRFISANMHACQWSDWRWHTPLWVFGGLGVLISVCSQHPAGHLLSREESAIELGNRALRIIERDADRVTRDGTWLRVSHRAYTLSSKKRYFGATRYRRYSDWDGLVGWIALATAALSTLGWCWW